MDPVPPSSSDEDEDGPIPKPTSFVLHPPEQRQMEPPSQPPKPAQPPPTRQNRKRKRIRRRVAELSESDEDAADAMNPEWLPPKQSVAKSAKAELAVDVGAAKIEPVVDASDCELSIVNGVGTAYGVPIYTRQYFECADLKQKEAFPERELALLCIELAVRKDSEIRKDQYLRSSRDGRQRNRVVVKENEDKCTFEKGCPNNRYMVLFSECFVSL